MTRRTEIGDLGKIPPQSVEVETSILGSMVMSSEAVVIATELLTSESFYKTENALIFSAISTLNDLDKNIDLMTVVEQLKKDNNLDTVGIILLTKLTDSFSGDVLVEQHCLILKEKQTARAQIAFGGALIQRAFDSSLDVFETNEFMSDEVHSIQNLGEIKTEVTNQDTAKALIAKMEKAKANKGVVGVPTGFHEQDKLFGGWQDGDLIILAARPGMGKTAKALSDVLNMVMNYSKTVIFFSLEMSALQLFQRLCSMYMGIPADKFRTGDLSDDEWKLFHQKLEPLLSDKLIIVDNCYSVSEIRNKVKRLRMKHKVDCVYIDYLQIAEGKGQSREQEISYISRQFKMMAKEINSPVVALSQLSRKVDERGDKRPKLSDLRESGAIEQDADVVTFLYRPAYYDEQDSDGMSYLIVAKHRNGSLNDIKLIFEHSRTIFKNIETKPF